MFWLQCGKHVVNVIKHVMDMIKYVIKIMKHVTNLIERVIDKHVMNHNKTFLNMIKYVLNMTEHGKICIHVTLALPMGVIPKIDKQQETDSYIFKVL